MIVLRHVDVIDAVADELRADVDVIVEGQRFTAVARGAASGVLPPDATVIEIDDGVLLPGLIDCHVHYTLDANDPEGILKSQYEPPEPAARRAAAVAKRALEAGITTARSAGAQHSLDLAMRDAISTGHVSGPRLLAAGPAITTTRGHGYQFSHEVDDLDDVLKALRANVRNGVDVIKIMSGEAAMLTPETEGIGIADAGAAQYSEAELRAVVSEADRLNRRVMSHAQSPDAVIRSARAGVASVEHAFLADDEAITALVEAGTVLVPTLVVTDVWSQMDGISSEQRARQDAIETRHRRSAESAIRRGVRTVTGTDTGVPGVQPEVLWREVLLLAEHGARPIDALRSATIWAAELLGVDAEVGSIEVGKQADAIVIEGDPMADLGRLEHPRLVMQAGSIVHRRPD